MPRFLLQINPFASNMVLFRVQNPLALALAAFVVLAGPMNSRAAEEPAQKTLFLPKSPVAAAYVLARLSNK